MAETNWGGPRPKQEKIWGASPIPDAEVRKEHALAELSVMESMIAWCRRTRMSPEERRMAIREYKRRAQELVKRPGLECLQELVDAL